MKKKLWLIIGAIILLLTACITLLLWGKNITVGRCVAADNGSYLLIDGGSPISMSDRAWGDPFRSLTSGDEILVVHDGVAESYPGKTGAYLCIKLSEGSMDDISEDVVNSLTELGWLKAQEPQQSGELPADYDTAVFSHDTGSIQLNIPARWEYTVDKDTQGIRFWLPGKEEHVISVYCCTNSFGVCGTGLKEETVTFPNGMDARIGTYDNSENWSFIFFPGQSEYAITHTCSDEWWDSYGKEATAIINTLSVYETTG